MPTSLSTLLLAMLAYPSFCLDTSKTTVLVLAAILLSPGFSASGSRHEGCNGEELILNGCAAPVIRNEYPINSLDALLQTQCSESQNDCHLVSRKHDIANIRGFCRFNACLTVNTELI